MSDAILVFGFAAFVEIYLLGMLFVILRKLELETDEKKEKTLLWGFYYLIFIMVSIPIALTVGFFCMTNDGAATTSTITTDTTIQQDQQLTIIFYILAYGIFTFFEMLIFVPLAWLFSMFKTEKDQNIRKSLLRQIYLIASSGMAHYITIIVLSLIAWRI
jgi:hypothetical protein